MIKTCSATSILFFYSTKLLFCLWGIMGYYLLLVGNYQVTRVSVNILFRAEMIHVSGDVKVNTLFTLFKV